MFNELSSNLATLEASRATDAYGLLPGHKGQQSDAERAYAQAQLGARKGASACGNAPDATETWVSLPDELVPEDHERRSKNPVYQLKSALYGHPDAGGDWERHCTKAVKECGCKEM